MYYLYNVWQRCTRTLNYLNVPTFVSYLLACNPETTILPPRRIGDYICTKKNARKSMKLHNPAAHAKILDAFFFFFLLSFSFSFYFSSMRRRTRKYLPLYTLKIFLRPSCRHDWRASGGVTLRRQTAGVARLLVIDCKFAEKKRDRGSNLA